MRKVIQLNFLCELDAMVAPLDPWSFWLDERAIILLCKYSLINIWNHVRGLDKGKAEGRTHENIVLREGDSKERKAAAQPAGGLERRDLDHLLGLEQLHSVLTVLVKCSVKVLLGLGSVSNLLVDQSSKNEKVL